MDGPGVKAVLGGRYELGPCLGAGGMAAVHEAIDLELGRPVAVKLLQEYDEDLEVRHARFRREARILARISHPNVVAIHDAGIERGQRYLVMELVRGSSLEDLLEAGALASRRAVEVIEAVARAVDHVHRLGVVHRDIKPDNILLTGDGVAKLGDFGIAISAEEFLHLTGSGHVLGTPNYMSPEQLSGRRDAIGPATDVYALGATLYGCLADRPPFEPGGPIEQLARRIAIGPPPLRSIDPAIASDLEAIVRTAMAPDPLLRYPSAAALADDLRRWLDGEPIRVRPVTRLERLARAIQRRRAVLAPLAGGLVLAAIALGGWWLATR